MGVHNSNASPCLCFLPTEAAEKKRVPVLYPPGPRGMTLCCKSQVPASAKGAREQELRLSCAWSPNPPLSCSVAVEASQPSVGPGAQPPGQRAWSNIRDHCNVPPGDGSFENRGVRTQSLGTAPRSSSFSTLPPTKGPRPRRGKYHLRFTLQELERWN